MDDDIQTHRESIKVVVYYNVSTRQFEIVETSSQNVFDGVDFREAVKLRNDLNDFFAEGMSVKYFIEYDLDEAMYKVLSVDTEQLFHSYIEAEAEADKANNGEEE